MGIISTLFVFIVVSLFTTNFVVNFEFFTSVSDLETLITTEASLSKIINTYIDNELDRLNRLRNLVQHSRSNGAILLSISKSHMMMSQNPIDIYLDIKRTVINDRSIYGLLMENTARDLLAFINELKMPSENDLHGAAVALTRLQETYRLKPEELALGKIKHYAQTTRMTSDDIFNIGYAAFVANDWHHALQWLHLAELTMQQEDEQSEQWMDDNVQRRTFERTTLYDLLAYAMHKKGNALHSIWYSMAINEIDPKHPNARFLSIYQQLGYTNKVWNGTKADLPDISNSRDMSAVFPMYEKLCRGEMKMNPKQQLKMTCYLQRETAYLFLAPVKVERISFRPDVVIFHQFISDEESEYLKRSAISHLNRALVVNEQKKFETDVESVEASFRIAKNMWINDYDSSIVERLSLRLSEVTNLDVEKAEAFQMANYGLAGHYEPHYDMVTDEGFVLNRLNDDNFGNRIATALLYLSQPVAGGATIFDLAKLTVFPIKNSCLFWYNLHRSGDPNLSTRHAGCPVLLGHKWVGNKWFHERGQEFRKPCHLHRRVIT